MKLNASRHVRGISNNMGGIEDSLYIASFAGDGRGGLTSGSRECSEWRPLSLTADDL